jgi:hypothetical protein
VGGIAAAGAVGALFVGVTALIIAALAIAAVLTIRRRRITSCSTATEPVALAAPARRHTGS